MRKHVPVLKEVKNKLEGIYIDPVFLNGDMLHFNEHVMDEEKIRKVINSLATKIRQNNTLVALPGGNTVTTPCRRVAGAHHDREHEVQHGIA